MVKFESFSLPQPILKALADMGFEDASPIQEAIIPLLLEGKDAIGQAQTGTGKTAAFGIPLVAAAMEGHAGLVLCPTRELAQQVSAEIDRIGAVAGIKSLPLYGGAAFGPQARALESGGYNIIVATPGRLRDHIERGTVDATAASIVVLDEADEMLKMGFAEEVESILNSVGLERQTLLFSATMPDLILGLAERHLKDPEHVAVAGENDSIATAMTEQLAVRVMHHEKLDGLVRILACERPTGALVFRHTREMVDELVTQLRAKGVQALAIHGGLAQAQREDVLERLREGRTKVLVATNVAARGLDVDSISHVFNYDAPREAESYVHRIGRTGRAGREGRSYLFVTPADRGRLRGIERVLGARLEWRDLPTDEDVRKALAKHTADWLDEQKLEASSEHRAVIAGLVEKGADPGTLAAKLLGLVAKHEGLGMPQLEQRRAPDPRAAPRMGHGAGGHVRAGNGETIAVVVNVGRDDGVRPGDLVGALANEGGLTGADVGRIDILPRMSVAEIPAELVNEVLERMHTTMIRGRPAGIRVAERWQFRNPARGAAPPMMRR